MLRNTAIYLLVLTIILATSCTKDKSLQGGDESSMVKFYSSSATTMCRITDSANGSSWNYADGIGVSMVNSQTLEVLASNYGYESVSVGVSTTSFKSLDEENTLYYPNNCDVNFYAYYPYRSDMVDNIYKVDASVQDDKVNFCYAMAFDKNDSDESVQLDFYHKMSHITLNISCIGTVEQMSNLSVNIINTPTQADYSVITGERVGELSGSDAQLPFTLSDLVENETGEVVSAKATAYVLPECSNYTVIFSLNNNSYYSQFSDCLSGYWYSFNVFIGENYVNIEEDYIINDWRDTVYVNQIDTSLVEDDNQDEDGSEAYPYSLTSASDLAKIGSSDAWSMDAHYKLTGDVNLQNTASDQWIPIGSESDKFTGSIDGGGHTLSGLMIDNSSSYQAFVSYLGSGGEVRNIKVSGSISAGDFAAGIVANNEGVVVNCINDVDMICSASSVYAGAVVAYNYGSVINCCNVAELKSSGFFMGGVIGVALGGSSVYNCVNVADMTSVGAYLSAGVVAYADEIAGDINISKCYFMDDTASVSGLGGSFNFVSYDIVSKLSSDIYSTEFASELSSNAESYNSENTQVTETCAWSYSSGSSLELSFSTQP